MSVQSERSSSRYYTIVSSMISKDLDFEVLYDCIVHDFERSGLLVAAFQNKDWSLMRSCIVVKKVLGRTNASTDTCGD